MTVRPLPSEEFYTSLTLCVFTLRLFVCCLSSAFVCSVVVVITLPLPQDGGTTIQVHAVSIIEIRLGERWHAISNKS